MLKFAEIVSLKRRLRVLQIQRDRLDAAGVDPRHSRKAKLLDAELSELRDKLAKEAWTRC